MSKTTIYILSWTSYCEGDNYFDSDIKTFTDEEEARHEFASYRDQAIEESRWASLWEASESEREGETPYTVNEKETDSHYTVSSQAYGGYHVEVKLIKQEIEIK